MAGTLFFVHGTGVRKSGYEATLEDIRRGCANEPRLKNVVIADNCPWGEELGVDAQLVNLTLPPEERIRVAPGLEEGSCDAEAAQRFVGQKADETTVKAAVAASGAKAARVIKPDMMVTMDFRGDRLNIRVDDAGNIIAVTCG